METEVNIPIKDTDQFVSISLENIDDIIDMLTNELPDINLWIYIAVNFYFIKQVLYFNANRGDITEKLLKIITDDDTVKKYYENDINGRIAVLSYLSAYYAIQAFKSNDDKHKQEEYYTAAIKCSGLIDELERQVGQSPFSWICRGYQYLFKSDKDNPQQEFSNALKTKPNCIPALIGMACVFYIGADYQSTMAEYKQVLQTTKDCPSSVRVGIGMCHYKLNNIEYVLLYYLLGS